MKVQEGRESETAWTSMSVNISHFMAVMSMLCVTIFLVRGTVPAKMDTKEPANNVAILMSVY